MHALAGVGDRVVVHVQVDGLAHQAASSRERPELVGARLSGPVAYSALTASGWTNTRGVGEVGEVGVRRSVNVIGELSWLTGPEIAGRADRTSPSS